MARGDHIFVHCKGFSHHGIDCGDGNVVHFDFTPKRKFFSCVSGDTSRIRETSIEEFSGGREIQVRQYTDAFDAEQVIRRAKSRIGESGYHLFGKNCEHFAHWCKTGVSDSSQIEALNVASRPLAHGTIAASVIRVLPIVPLPFRVAASGVTLAYSIGRSTATYFRQRREDILNSRS